MYEMEMNAIAARLRNRRKELHLSLQELGDLTGISRSTLQRYETGCIRNVPLSRLSTLAEALQTTASELIGWEDSAKKAEPEPPQALLLRDFTRLTPGQQEDVLKFIRFLLSQENG